LTNYITRPFGSLHSIHECVRGSNIGASFLVVYRRPTQSVTVLWTTHGSLSYSSQPNGTVPNLDSIDKIADNGSLHSIYECVRWSNIGASFLVVYRRPIHGGTVLWTTHGSLRYSSQPFRMAFEWYQISTVSTKLRTTGQCIQYTSVFEGLT
jgi:hypothetical protein